MAGPVGVEELAARLVDALVGVRAEVVALRLQQIGGQPCGAVAVKEGQSGGEGRGGHAQLNGVDQGLAPRGLVLIERAEEEAIEEQIIDVRDSCRKRL